MRFQRIATLALLVLSTVLLTVGAQDHRKDAFISLEEKVAKEQEAHARTLKSNAREKKRAAKKKFVKKIEKMEKNLGDEYKKKIKAKEKRHEEVHKELKEKDKIRERKTKHMEHDKKQHEKKEKKRRRMNAGRREL